MQYFIDSATGAAWAFDDDVKIAAGVAESSSGSVAVPATLAACTEDQAASAAVPKPLTGDALLQANAANRDRLLNAVALQVAPLQDAADLGVATDDEATHLKLWKEYRIALSRVDLTQESPAWPSAPSV